MFYSFFVYNNNQKSSVHVFSTEKNMIFEVSEPRKIADNIALFIENTLPSTPIDEVIFSTGPSSFTTTRVINSVIKGMKIVNPSTKFIGVSTFLTYLSIINKPNGLIALPTFRGDYFTSEFNNYILSDIEIHDLEYVKKYNSILDTCILNTCILDTNILDTSILNVYNYNLAKQQFITSHLDDNSIANNTKFISNELDIGYQITPVFRKQF